MQCKKCGAEFEGKYCPDCGAPAEQPQLNEKNKKPIYKRAWFVVLGIVIVLALISELGSTIKGRGEKINWSSLELSQLLPEPSSKRGEINTNTDNELWIDINKTDGNEFKEYVSACKEMGYTIDSDSSSLFYEAFNDGGYKLRVDYYSHDESMTIQLNAPEEYGSYDWPSSMLAQLLPQPKSATGKMSFEKENSFFLYVNETTKDDYKEYVDACAERGFSVNYSKEESYYSAENEYGYHLTLRYEGNNVMSISIEGPTDKENIDNTMESDDINGTKDGSGSEITSNGLRTDFKNAMDSYEAFMDEYIAFMKTYQASNGFDANMAAEYGVFMTKYAEACRDFDNWESEGLNDAETLYYIEVQTRVNQKLLSVTG